MPKIKIVCECGNIVDATVGQDLYENDLRWYMSYRCGNCGKAVEIDENGNMPEEIRKAIIKEEGEWRIILNDSKDLTKVVYILKKEYDLEDTKELKEKIKSGLITGTKSEMMKIEKVLSDKGIENINIVRV